MGGGARGPGRGRRRGARGGPDRAPPRSLFAQCHALAPPQHYYEACVFDTCTVPNSGLECASLQSYAALCAHEGVCIDWRNHTHGACRECPSLPAWAAPGSAGRCASLQPAGGRPGPGRGWERAGRGRGRCLRPPGTLPAVGGRGWVSLWLWGAAPSLLSRPLTAASLRSGDVPAPQGVPRLRPRPGAHLQVQVSLRGGRLGRGPRPGLCRRLQLTLPPSSPPAPPACPPPAPQACPTSASRGRTARCWWRAASAPRAP